jgi:Zn-dependent protease with chaperone function
MGEFSAKSKGLMWIGLSLLLVLIFILGLPFLAKQVPWSFEKKMAKYLENRPELQACAQPPGNLALQKIVTRLYPQFPDDSKFPLHVEVIAGKTVNAFASLGGQIYVYDGLLQKAESPEELAGVLAHEIEHVHHRHILQGAFTQLLTLGMIGVIFDPGSAIDPRLLTFLMNLRFSREQESEADLDGLRRLHAAKIDVTGFQHFFERAENKTEMPSLLSDHPASENRSALAKSFFTVDTLPLLKNSEWRDLRNICSATAE